MKKLMFRYLCEAYPNAYTYRTKFGDVRYRKDDKEMAFHIDRRANVDKLMLLFSCRRETAESIFNEWCDRLPVYVRVENSTNESVLVPLQTEYIPTFLNL